MDWQRWLARWDAQQTLYVPEREERFAVVADVVAAAAGPAPRVLDLGCGPGALATRLLDRLPAATVVAVDADPVLLTLGRQAVGDRGGRLSWVDANLRDESWPARLPPGGRYDAAASSTALHWLSPAELPTLYRQVAALLRPGGVFVDADNLAFEPTEPVLSALVPALRRSWDGRSPVPPAEDWEAWWAAVRAEPAFAAALAERDRRRHEHPRGDESNRYASHRDALAAAGFSEIGTVWQRADDRVLVAVR